MAKDMNMTMALFMAQGAACFYCGCDFEGRVAKKRPRAWTTDHVKPVSKGNTRAKNVVLACLTVTSIIVVVFNLLADILYGVLDPRIRSF